MCKNDMNLECHVMQIKEVITKKHNIHIRVCNIMWYTKKPLVVCMYALTPNRNKVLWISMVNFPNPNLSGRGIAPKLPGSVKTN